MSTDEFSRTKLLVGTDGLEKLRSAHVAVFGVGGVGGYAAESLARAGIGHLTLVDNDTVALSNCNRQIIALRSTIGQSKTAVMKKRILDINPSAQVESRDVFFDAETANSFDFAQFDFIADAIDTVSAKLLLVQTADRSKIPIISSMGAGNKLRPELFELADIYETSVCPLARVMRYELKKRGISSLRVVYSREKPLSYAEPTETAEKKGGTGHPVPGSISFVPGVAGLIMAGAIVRTLLGIDEK